MLRLLRWRLPLLHVLLLLIMPLLQLLGLLLMTLLYLLLSSIISPLLSQALVILLLFLLKPLAILLLPGIYLVLLLLVFLIYLRIAGVRCRWPLVRRKFVHVNWRPIGIVGPNIVAAARDSIVACAAVVSPNIVGVAIRLRWRFVTSACLPSWHDAALVECRRPGSSRDRRLALIHGCAQIPIGAGRLHVLHLGSDRRQVPLASSHLLLPRWALVDAAISAVVTDAINGPIVVYDRGVVGVVNLGDVDVVHGTVVVEAIAVPASTFITVAKISIAVVDAAVKANLRTPVAFVKEEGISAPAPISWRPEIADFRRLHPCAGHPVIIAVLVIPRPIPRRPEVAFGRAYGLFVHRERRWRKSHRNADTHLRKRRPGSRKQK